ncbi:MAG: S8 family serine peptidase [Pseudoxanthomonas sp.]
MKSHAPFLSILALAVCVAMAACSSGGGSKSGSSGSTVGSGGDGDGSTDTGSTYTGVADNLLMLTGADTAHEAGYTGTGVKVGLLDGSEVEGYAGLPANIVSYTDYTGTAVDTTADYYEHGTWMASIIAGAATDNYDGGVAPDADIYWARVCTSAGICSSTYITEAVEDLLAEGVSIFNMSFGGYDSDADSAAEASAWSTMISELVAADALAIVATGNDSATNASSLATAPYYLGYGSSNILAVTAAAVDSDGEVTGLASYANACGYAAQWCLTTVGTVVLDDVTISGTSVSTAIVTGAAALVAQAYPWMTGSNIQVTLLTTATDLGDEGVDSTYGWGLLNIAKAIYGPAQFYDVFTANVTSGYDSTFSNDISGVGSLVKEGAGTLRLTGTNTYTGGTIVDAGTLALTGSLGSDVTVNADGTFESDGGVINGNYTTTGTTAIYLDGGLTVTGTATLGGSLSLLSSSTYTAPTTATVLTAGAIDGTFASYSAGSSLFYATALSYDDTSVTATLSRTSSATVASVLSLSASTVDGGSQADAVVAALDKVYSSGQDTSAYESVAASVAAIIDTTDLAMVENNLKSLTGEVYGTARTLAFQQAATDQRIIGDRVDALRYNRNPNGAWLQTYDGDGTLSRDGYDSARIRASGFGAGADFALGERTTVGAALFTSKENGQLEDIGGHFRGHTRGVAVYAKQDLGDSGYVSAQAGSSRMDVDVNRTITYGSNAEELASSYGNRILHGRLEAGWNAASGFTPYAAVSSFRIAQDAIHEDTTSGLGLVAGRDTFHVTLGEAGLRYGRWLGQVYLGGNLSVAHVLGGGNTDYTASLDGLPGVDFTVAGQPIPRNVAYLGLHGVYAIDRNVDLFADLNLQQASGQTHEATATVGVRVGF